MSIRTLCYIVLITSVIISSSFGQAAIPPKPEVGDFVHDYAFLISDSDLKKIEAVQASAYADHSVPIVVVTIPFASNFKNGRSVDALAREWFNTWEIGTLERADGQKKNAGILILVSKGDRKARIELGADWGYSWNGRADEVMNGRMIPSFKKGDYSGGILKAVKALSEMAENDPKSEAPAPGLVETFKSILDSDKLTSKSLVSGKTGVALIGIGLVMIIAGLFMPSSRKWLIFGGVLLIAIALITFLAIIATFILLLNIYEKHHGGDDSDSSGGFWSSGSSGGGFSSGGGGFSGGGGGGFSGGGGSSGSW